MREQWFQLLRKQLKSEHGKGWGVRAMRGKVQLTLRVDESAGMKSPRNSVSLPVDWSADNQTKILNFLLSSSARGWKQIIIFLKNLRN